MRTLCHCSEQATVTVHDLLICPKCEDFLIRHPALKATLIEQWKALRAEKQLETSADAES